VISKEEEQVPRLANFRTDSSYNISARDPPQIENLTFIDILFPVYCIFISYYQLINPCERILYFMGYKQTPIWHANCLLDFGMAQFQIMIRMASNDTMAV